MQEYGQVFAEVYDKYWTEFTDYVAPRLLRYYEKAQGEAAEKSLLDLGCGTGQLCHFFLQRGYTVIGVDRSASMLRHAAERSKAHIDKGEARFIQADIAGFETEKKCGLAVALFDTLNHLEGIEHLSKCFSAVRGALLPGGFFIFDLNTAEGLKRWNRLDIQEDEEVTLIRRGFFAPGLERAYLQISGFVRRDNRLYERFSEVFFNTAFKLKEVEEKLESSGFEHIRMVGIDNMEESLREPEREGRVFVVARNRPEAGARP